MPQAGMQIAVERGALLSMLVKLLDARRILEIGTFTGYSSTAMALALPPDGRIVCCDISEEYTAVARRTWAAAGSRSASTCGWLQRWKPSESLLATDGPGSFDLAFIDADKASYRGYVEGRCSWCGRAA